MFKVINGTKISFYDSEENEIMFIDYPTDECIWYFSSSETITITEEMELYPFLLDIMSQQYTFTDTEVLKSYKDDNKLVWYSDCYYNPDDEWSKNNVSYLTIEHINGVFTLKCTKPLDNMIDRKNKKHIISFSPLGNGKCAQNVSTGLTLQDEFVMKVYQKLNEEKVKKI